MSNSLARVLILGGGYVGLYTAWGLQKRMSRVSMDVTVHLRSALPKANLFRGRLQSLDCEHKEATLISLTGETSIQGYDHVVFALGAITRTFPTPGLEENAVGFKTIEEALYVRNQVLDSIAKAASTTDQSERVRALSFVFVGGGYTGVEAIAELNELSKIALRRYPALNGWQPKWVLVEASDRVAVELGPKLSQWTLIHLRGRGIDVRLDTTLTSCVDGQVVLSDGESFGADTIVWTAGMKPNPILDATDAPRGPKGHVTGNAMLQIVREDGTVVDGAWAAGDIAQIPDLTAERQPAYYVTNAQNALRQAKLLAKNLTAQLQGKNLREYRHRSLGTLASYGVGTGAAMIMGIRLRGLPAWLVDRAYHGMAMPTVARKYRVFTGWATNMFAPRDITSLANTEYPRRSFVIGMESGNTDAPPRDSI